MSDDVVDFECCRADDRVPHHVLTVYQELQLRGRCN